MANTDRPNGFRPVGTLSGSGRSGQIRKFYTDTNAFLGDLMIQDAASKVNANSNGASQGVTRATSATTGEAIGVVVGWEPNPDSLGAVYHTGSAVYAVYLDIDPNTIFECQDNGAATLITAADVGLNYDIVVTAGSTTTGVSNMEVDSGTAGATTAGTPVKLIGIVDKPDNTIGVANAKLLVTINMHTYKTDLGTPGV